MIVRQAANVLDLLEFFVRRKQPATLVGNRRFASLAALQHIQSHSDAGGPRLSVRAAPAFGLLPEPALVRVRAARCGGRTAAGICPRAGRRIVGGDRRDGGDRRAGRHQCDFRRRAGIARGGALLRPGRPSLADPRDLDRARAAWRNTRARNASRSTAGSNFGSGARPRRSASMLSKPSFASRPSAATTRALPTSARTSPASPCRCRSATGGCRWSSPDRCFACSTGSSLSPIPSAAPSNATPSCPTRTIR